MVSGIPSQWLGAFCRIPKGESEKCHSVKCHSVMTECFFMTLLRHWPEKCHTQHIPYDTMTL
jgi:hypothetical protein